MSDSEKGLRRELGLPALAVYGIGGMLGGGIYALVGEVAAEARGWSWLSFLAAMAVAAPTAIAYTEMATRFPTSGGEASYCRAAFQNRAAPLLVGWLVLFSGVVSMAALARAFAGYVRELAPAAPAPVLAAAFLVALALVNVRGIRLASTANVVCTVVEASGLVAVIAAGAVVVWGGGASPPEASAAGGGAGVAAIASGAALAFYAFIGFEDMVNVAEEVREPRRAYPVAIPAALVIVGTIYALVAFFATRSVAPSELAASGAPLTAVVGRGAGWIPPAAVTLVALFAVANSALLNFIMASRLGYGMAREGLLPGWVAKLHARWRTPHRAIAVLLGVGIALALSGGVGLLAGATSFLLAIVFFAVNLALVRVRRSGAGEAGALRAPGFVPWLGMAVSAALPFFLPAESILVASIVVAAGLVFVAASLALGR